MRGGRKRRLDASGRLALLCVICGASSKARGQASKRNGVGKIRLLIERCREVWRESQCTWRRCVGNVLVGSRSRVPAKGRSSTSYIRDVSLLLHRIYSYARAPESLAQMRVPAPSGALGMRECAPSQELDPPPSKWITAWSLICALVTCRRRGRLWGSNERKRVCCTVCVVRSRRGGSAHVTAGYTHGIRDATEIQNVAAPLRLWRSQASLPTCTCSSNCLDVADAPK